jgi:hypothetical protein
MASKRTDDYLKRLTDYETAAPGDYQSKYQDQIDSVMTTIQGRKGLNYDFNADPLYHQYKDQYTKLGKEAAMNAAADVSALTGGFGNSYAATAASQANQQYLTQLNNIIPELARAAQERYDSETDNLYRQYGMLSDADATGYGRHRDAVGDYQTNRNYYYGQYRDSVGDDQWQDEFDYRKQQDEIARQQWQAQFDYMQTQDAQTQANWLAQQAYNAQQDALAQSNWQKQFDYTRSKDAQSQANWQAQFDYQRAMDAIKLAGKKGDENGNNADIKDENPPLAEQAGKKKTAATMETALKYVEAMARGGLSQSEVEDRLLNAGYSDEEVLRLVNSQIYKKVK